MKWKKDFGREIRLERLSWGMSIRKLSQLSHVDRENIEDIEKGIIDNPNFYEMLRICDVLDTSVYFYLEENDSKRKKEE